MSGPVLIFYENKVGHFIGVFSQIMPHTSKCHVRRFEVHLMDTSKENSMSELVNKVHSCKAEWFGRELDGDLRVASLELTRVTVSKTLYPLLSTDSPRTADFPYMTDNCRQRCRRKSTSQS